MLKQVRGREQRSGAGGEDTGQPQAAQVTYHSGPLATTLKELKTLALRALHRPRGCQRPSPGPHCPTWPSGSLPSLGGTYSLSLALLCLHQALGMSSSQPLVSASCPSQHYGLQGHDLSMVFSVSLAPHPPWGVLRASQCGVRG